MHIQALPAVVNDKVQRRVRPGGGEDPINEVVEGSCGRLTSRSLFGLPIIAIREHKATEMKVALILVDRSGEPCSDEIPTVVVSPTRNREVISNGNRVRKRPGTLPTLLNRDQPIVVSVSHACLIASNGIVASACKEHRSRRTGAVVICVHVQIPKSRVIGVIPIGAKQF